MTTGWCTAWTFAAAAEAAWSTCARSHARITVLEALGAARLRLRRQRERRPQPVPSLPQPAERGRSRRRCGSRCPRSARRLRTSALQVRDALGQEVSIVSAPVSMTSSMRSTRGRARSRCTTSCWTRHSTWRPRHGAPSPRVRRSPPVRGHGLFSDAHLAPEATGVVVGHGGAFVGLELHVEALLEENSVVCMTLTPSSS